MTDAAFLAWIRTQSSCITGRGDWVENLGENRCDAAHVRRANTFGTAFKAEFSAVPLTHFEHDIQTRLGELTCLMEFLGKGEIRRLFYGKPYEDRVIAAKEWFDAQVLIYRQRWAEETPEGRAWAAKRELEVTA